MGVVVGGGCAVCDISHDLTRSHSPAIGRWGGQRLPDGRKEMLREGKDKCVLLENVH